MSEELNQGCQCGEKKIYKLEIHHVDGNHKNNSKDNLEVVCSNCHKVRHLMLTKDGWRYYYRALTPRELIEKLI